MKNILIGAALAFAVFVTLSYKTTEDGGTGANERRVFIMPLKQTSVAVTTNKDYVIKLINKGYVVQDVDVVYDDFHSKCIYSYTLIKY